nr:hypothetical protein [Bacilli bacterium]
MGFLTLPIYYLGMFLFSLAVIVQFTVGGLAFDQMWTNTALKNATSAGITQVVGGGGGIGSAQVINVVDAENIANQEWSMQNQAWTPSGQPITATFTPGAVNSLTPAGSYDTLTGTAVVAVQENAINHLIDTFGKTVNNGGTITDTISSSLPGTLS